MKKVLTLLMVMMFTLMSFAQPVVEKYDSPKFFDNTYITVNGGVATPTVGEAFWKDLNGNAGIRLGKDITPIFGVAIGTNAYFSEIGKQSNESSLWCKYLNTTVLAKVNVLNCFGYNSDRKWNVSALVGPGWAHSFVHKSNDVTANFAVNVSYDVAKRWSIYVEPALIYGLQKPETGGLNFNINRSITQLNAGVVYKFGKTTFTKSKYVALEDYNKLSDDVYSLKSELAKKPKTVEVPVEKTITEYVNNTTVITFAQGSSTLSQAAKNQLDELSKTVKSVKLISGTASPEGSKEFNQELSLQRARNVAHYLADKGVYADGVEGLGNTGDESQRIVTITIK